MQQFQYNIEEHGYIKFIKIYEVDGPNDEPKVPMAKIYFTKYPKVEVIRYDITENRDKFKIGFNAYTLIYDTRVFKNPRLKRFLNK